MSKYRVLYTDTVIQALDKQIEYMKDEMVDEKVISSWMNRLLDSVDSLESFPNRCPIAEKESEIKGFTIRKLIFGDYITCFQVNEKQKCVEVLSFRHGAKLPDEET